MPTPQDTLFYQAQSAVDLTAYMLPHPHLGISDVVKLGTLSMLSVSTHRDKFPVSALSRIGPRGFTSGHRMIAGTLAFSTIDREAFSTIFNDDAGQNGFLTRFAAADDLPPFNISIVLINDFGHASYSVIEGVTILDTGVTYSMDNVALMESYSYMALNRTPLHPIGAKGRNEEAERQIDEYLRLSTPDQPFTVIKPPTLK